MKKIIILLLLSPIFITAQVASVDFFVINDGMEEEYLEMEKVWVEFHKQMIAEGKMYGWSLFKVVSTSSEEGDSPDYMTLNRFESIEAMEAMWSDMNYEKFLKIVKKKVKGKLSTRKIKKIVEAKVKKSHHSYVIEMTDQTVPSIEMEVGEILQVDAMIQQVDDYEGYETNIAKPILQRNVNDGNLKWWGLTKVSNRNDQALKEITHFTWQIPVEGKEMDWWSEKSSSIFGGEFAYGKLANLVGESRKVLGSGKLQLIISEK
jgi:hypothetical protein